MTEREETITRFEAIIKESKNREAEFLARDKHFNTCLARYFQEYGKILSETLEPLRHITESDMSPPK
jgi:hypothetical protein